MEVMDRQELNVERCVYISAHRCHQRWRFHFQVIVQLMSKKHEQMEEVEEDAQNISYIFFFVCVCV